MAKKAARLAKAKQAHDDLIAATYRAQADALEIESQAKRRLADEYDAAQERGEITTQRDNQAFSAMEKASGPDIVPPRELHDARLIRDAEQVSPANRVQVEFGASVRAETEVRRRPIEQR